MTKGTSFPRDNTVPKLLIISVKKKSLRNRLRPTDSNRAPPKNINFQFIIVMIINNRRPT
jgi:hypothetical protein